MFSKSQIVAKVMVYLLQNKYTITFGRVVFVELNEIMRQKYYQKFAMALNNFAKCTLTDKDSNLLNGRLIEKESFHILPLKAIHLFSTNTSVNVHNESVLNTLCTEGYEFIAIDSLVGDTGEELTEMLMDTIK